MPSWRIVFSTFRDCMSFYTARVIHDRGGRSHPSVHVRFTPKATITDQHAIRRFVPIRDKVHRSERALFDHLIGESTRVLAPPLAHGTDDRAEVATLCGEDVLGPRGTHRIEASLDDALLLKRPQTLR